MHSSAQISRNIVHTVHENIFIRIKIYIHAYKYIYTYAYLYTGDSTSASSTSSSDGGNIRDAVKMQKRLRDMAAKSSRLRFVIARCPILTISVYKK